MLKRRCKLHSSRLDRFQFFREDVIFDRASPTGEKTVGGSNFSILAVVVEETVDNPCVVETESDCSSGEAGFDGIVIQGGERKFTIGSIGCPKVEGVKVGKSKTRSVKTGSESSLSIDLNTRN